MAIRRATTGWVPFVLPLAWGLMAGPGCGQRDATEETASIPPDRIAWVSDGDMLALATDGAPTLDAGTTVAGVLEPSDPRLASGSRYDLYAGEGQAGDLLRVRMRSTAFVPQLALVDASGEKARILDLAVAEEAGFGLELAFELLHGGPYLVLATSAHGGEGSYSVTVVTEPVWDPPPRSRADQTYALLVSIADYPRRKIDLDGPHRDADLFAKLLVERFGVPPENILRLRDEYATRRRVTSAWLDHLGQAGENGAAVFYYSGHGVQIPQTAETSRSNREPDAKDEALLLANGSLLIDDELGFLADGLAAGSTTLVLDCCYSGTASRARGAQPKRAWMDQLDFPVEVPPKPFGLTGSRKAGPRVGRSHRLLAASEEDEVAWLLENPALGFPEPRSVFTHYLTEIAASSSLDRALAEIAAAVRASTRSAVRENLGQNQTPRFSGIEPSEPLGALTVRR